MEAPFSMGTRGGDVPLRLKWLGLQANYIEIVVIKDIKDIFHSSHILKTRFLVQHKKNLLLT